MVFELCFNTVAKNSSIRKVILTKILPKVTCLPQILAMLQYAFERIEQENFIGGTERDRAIIDALLTVFQVSHLHSEDPWQSEERLHTAQCENLFESYSAWYVLMNVQSPLIEDVAGIQSFYHERDVCLFSQNMHEKYNNRFFFEVNKTKKVR